MKISIIVHSSTGSTRAFSNVISHALTKAGHHVDQTLLHTNPVIKTGTARHCAPFKITNLPDCSGYDLVLIGGPVWAFSASPVVMELIRQLSDIKGKRVIPFVTMAFPLKIMGGVSAIALMSATLRVAGADVLPGVIVGKLFHDLKRDMFRAAEGIVEMVK